MLNFLSMIGTYEQRKIKNTVINEATIDTCRVTDTEKGFETGIQHSLYNNGSWVIVEEYYSKDEAEKGHDKWVELFKKELPKELKDVSSASTVKLAKAFGVNINKTYKAKKKTSITK